MSESLKEKGLTLEELEKIAFGLHDELTWGKQKPFCNITTPLSHQEFNQKSAEYHSDLWVRLEDAEQEIEKIKGLAEETSRIMIEAEREELKQKLQRRYDECKRIEETTASPLWREGARWNMKLIEELLEEEKKAKPT